MSSEETQLSIRYEFVEEKTKKILGGMSICGAYVKDDGWTTTEDLEVILDGGIAGGLQFLFPCQGANMLSHGHGFLEALQQNTEKMPYGSSTGEYIDTGCIIGRIAGYLNGNEIMTMTFEENGIPYPDGSSSPGHCVTTMLNNADEDCEMGEVEESDPDSEEHGDKYIYQGQWTRSDLIN